LAAYLLSNGGDPVDEPTIREQLPPYGEVYDASLGPGEQHNRSVDAVRKQLRRDVAALARAGVRGGS
jgi:hypothetical protein